MDFNECKEANGWHQFDLDQDATHFGVWITLRLVNSYVEGDVILVQCPTDASYRAELERMCAFYGVAPSFVSIDPVEGAATEHYQDRQIPFYGLPEPD